MTQMTPASMPMSPTPVMSVLMMAAMMVPSAVVAAAQRATDRDGVLAAPVFTSTYLGVWALAGLALWVLYRPPSGIVAGALVAGAGLYELTPLKHACRRRCRKPVRSGVRFGAYCFGSSIGLMLVVAAVDVMSIPLMCAVAAVVLAQKLFPPHPALDVPLALAIIAAGVAIAAS